MLAVFKADWCGRCETGSGGMMHKDGTKKFKPPINSCHSGHLFLHICVWVGLKSSLSLQAWPHQAASI